MERNLRALLVCAVLVSWWTDAIAYKQNTHADIAKRAIERSEVNAAPSGILESLHVGTSVQEKAFLVPSWTGTPTPTSVEDLLMRGAREEDDGLKSLRHFFDPQRDGAGYLSFEPSPTWALGSGSEGQTFDLEDARSYLFDALTGHSEQQRIADLTRVFLALGHVIHHIQDMHQPQHVRSDIHCDDTPLAAGYLALPNGCATVLIQNLLHRPSAYEQYVWERGLLPMDGYPVPDYATFDTPRKFWESGGKGGAEFTSANFVSAASNFRLDTSTSPIAIRTDGSHPWPRGSDASLVTADINDPAVVHRVTDPMPMAGEISFVRTPIIDAYDPSLSGVNDRTSTLSIWYDSEILGTGEVLATGYPVFTLNSANLEAAARILLPRATAYSTGLINYFFRGRIEIGLPEQGVYGVLDHATTYAAGQGFDKLKLKLRNASPDGVTPSGEHVPQSMQGGTLVAVAKYTLNSCYQPDLSGDFAARYDTGEVVWPANCSYDQYVSGEELISQSAAILASSLDTSAADFTFDFSSQPIPVDARDLRIQVVYTGQLGAEADGIAFGGRDISEPTYVVVYNNSDYFALDGKFYTPAEIRSDPAKAQRVAGINIDPKPLVEVALSVVSGKPLTSASGSVPVNGYVRVALLADRDEPITVNVLSRFEGTGYSMASFPGIPPNVTDLRSEDGYVTALGIFRGPRGNFFDVNFKTNADVPVSAEELTAMSTRMAADPGPTPIPLRF